MAINNQNFEIGEGDVSLKFEGEEAAVDIGACANAELDVKVEDLDIEVGQFIDPVDNFDVGRQITFGVDMMEDTLRNFVAAIGGNPGDINTTDPTKDVYVFPANSVSTSKFCEIIYSVKRVRQANKVKKITLHRCKAKDGIKISFKKKALKTWRATFMAYADPTNSNSPGSIEYQHLGE